MIAGATEPANLFGVGFLSFKGSMYPKKIPATRKKSQHGILYLRVNCYLDGKIYDARVEQEPLDTQFCLNLSQSELLGGRHKEGRSRGTGHDPTSLKHRKVEGRIAADVFLNIGI